MAKFSKAGLTALAAGVAVALTACGPSYETYVEGYWDNGDEFLAPAKSELFDADGVPTCEYPIRYNYFESRSRPQYLINALLFEIQNPETDPATIERSDYSSDAGYEDAVESLERLQNSDEILFQYTHPVFFDAERGIESAEDLNAVKAELADHLSDLGTYPELNVTDYYTIGSEYIVTDQGEYDVRRLVDPEGYLEEVGFTESFNGLRYSYQVATDFETEFLLVRDKEEGTVRLFEGNEQLDLSGVLFFTEIDVNLPYLSADELEADRAAYEADEANSAPYEVAYPDGPDAQILLASDGCGRIGTTDYARYYLADYTLLSPELATEEDPWADVEGLGTESEDEEAA